jgi:hypothetical protein
MDVAVFSIVLLPLPILYVLRQVLLECILSAFRHLSVSVLLWTATSVRMSGHGPFAAFNDSLSWSLPR